jgi:ribose transport system permease protein
LVFIGARLVSESLPSWLALQSILSFSLFVTVIALGQGLVMLTGGLDLSVPGVIALAATVTAMGTSVYNWNIFIAVVLALAAAFLVGIFNGYVVARFNIPAFIVTLAVNGILVGLTIGWTFGHKAPASPEAIVTLFSGSGKLFGIGLPVFFFILVAIVGYMLQMKGRFGRNAYLMGSSAEAARIAGRPTLQIMVSIYAVCGLGSGVAGIMLLGFSGNAQLSLGDEWLIPAVSAVLVGGTMIGSGRGFWQSTVVAAVLLTTITVVIGATGLSEGWKSVLYGVVVLVALLTTRITGFGRRKAPKTS